MNFLDRSASFYRPENVFVLEIAQQLAFGGNLQTRNRISCLLTLVEYGRVFSALGALHIYTVFSQI